MYKFLSAFFLLLSSIVYSQTYTVSGHITDQTTGESLLFADCYDTMSNRGTTTNAYGYYSLSLSKGKIHLKVSYLGYKTTEKSFVLSRDTILALSLVPISEKLGEVMIDKQESIHKQTLMGKITVPISTIKKIPSFVGETDLMKSLSYLPGITTGKEGYSNIFVRGGDRGQNLILLDGIKLYNTNHIGGFLSLINSDILKQVDIYKGGFPARYGGRASSIIDIYTKDGNSRTLNGKFSIGVLASSILLEGPFNHKTSYYFAARTSYYDLFTLKNRRIYKKTGRNGYFGYTIFDINSKINWKFSDTNNMSFSFYTGHDFQSAADEVLSIREDDKSYSKSRIHNTGVSLNHYYAFHSKWFLKNTLSFSNYSTSLENGEKDATRDYNYRTSSNINDITWQGRLEFYPNTVHRIKTGVEASYYYFIPGVQTISSEIESTNHTTTSGFTKSITSFEANIYLEDEIKLSKKTRLNLGLRGTVYKPKDTAFYRIEPRMSFRWLVNDHLSLKANYTVMNQYNHALIKNYQGFEEEIWLSATKDLIPQRASQFSSGVFYSNTSKNIAISLESYYKKMSNLLEYHSPTTDADNLNNIENIVAKNGRGEAYGFEIQFKKETKRFTGSLNYTLAWNYRQFDNLNNGIKYPFIYDRRHNLTFLTSYKLDKYYTLTSSFNLASGTRVTLPVGYVKPDDFSEAYFVYSSINNGKLPLYHRLDMAISRVRENKKGKKRQVSLNIYNVYARHNAVSIYFDENTGKIKQRSLFSIIPSLSYTLEF